MRNHHNHEPSLEVKSQASWLGTKDKDLHLIRCHFRQVIPCVSQKAGNLTTLCQDLWVASRPNISCLGVPAGSQRPECRCVCQSEQTRGKLWVHLPQQNQCTQTSHINSPENMGLLSSAHLLCLERLIISCDQSRFRVQSKTLEDRVLLNALIKKLLFSHHHISWSTELLTSLPQSKFSFILWPFRASCPDKTWENECNHVGYCLSSIFLFMSLPVISSWSSSFSLAYKLFNVFHETIVHLLFLVIHSAWDAFACTETIISGVFIGILVVVSNSDLQLLIIYMFKR